MKDMQAKLSKLLDDANDCDLIANLATDRRKRAVFRRTALELRESAARLRADIAACKAEADAAVHGEYPGFH